MRFSIVENSNVEIVLATDGGMLAQNVISLREDCVDPSTTLACENQDADSLEISSLPAGVYSVLVRGDGAQAGLTINATPVPVLEWRDSCDGLPFTLSEGVFGLTGDYDTATNQLDVTTLCQLNSNDQDLFFTFELATQQTVSARIINGGGQILLLNQGCTDLVAACPMPKTPTASI